MGLIVCVIGCGGIATGYHGPALRRYADLHPDMTLSGCCDLDSQRAKNFQGRFGFQTVWTDHRTMLDAVKPDVVCLLTNPRNTVAAGIDVMRRGCALLLEKPPGETVAEVDRLIAAARESGVPTRVAFNRRHIPLVQELKKQLYACFPLERIQHIRYDFSRVDRKDADFSTTAIHGIDAVRFITGSDYDSVRFRYQSLPDIGSTVANFFMDAVLLRGMTAHLNFCPLAGVTTERVTVHAHNHTFFLNLPLWKCFDTPGRLQHFENDRLVLDVDGAKVAGSEQNFITDGFYGETASFFDDLSAGAGRNPEYDLANSRQSVEIAQCLRERQKEYCRSG